MGFRFRKSFRLGKLVRLNLGTKSASVSLGVPGARVNVGTRGTRVTAGVPGTGLSWSAQSSSGRRGVASAGSDAAGCGAAFAVLVGLGFLAFIALAIGVSSGPIYALVFVAVVVAAWIAIARHNKHWRDVREAERLAAWDRYQQEQWAQQQHEAAERARREQAEAAEQARRLQLAAHERQQRQLYEDAQRERLRQEQERQRQERWQQLVERWGNEDARKIWTGRPWVGCTAEMLVATLGPPLDTDTKVLKTKTKETYKYRHQGANRYGLRVSLDDGVVTGWEEKD